MQAFHYHTTVTKEHGLQLPPLPLSAGQEVTVTVEVAPVRITKRNFPLRGLPHSYHDPFAPSWDADDWNMLKDTPDDPA